jgi:error-prone DNA polymerase
LEGASHPDELVARASELGYQALAITDRNSLAGIVRAHAAAKTAGLKLLVGAEITPHDGPPVLLYAPDLAAYRRLCRLITHGRRSASKGECCLSVEDVARHAEGLLAVVLPQRAGNVSDGPQNPSLTLPARWGPYGDLFSRRCYLAASLHLGADDRRQLDQAIQLSRRLRIPLVATNDVYYHAPERRPLHDVLTAIRHHTTVAELGGRRFPNGEHYLKSPAQMVELFGRCPQALRHGLELAQRCRFSLDELRYEYPEELSPPGLTPIEHLSRLTWEGATQRYPNGLPEKVRQLLCHELRLIEELHYEAYFLTVWDLVVFARNRGILCQGRGSAANSAVCFCLGITSVDPDRTDVLFERFVSQERNEPPDIDVDFEHERREEVIQYIYRKYGWDRAALTAEVITYRPRSAIRDVGKALGLSLDRVDRLAKTLDSYRDESDFQRYLQEAGLEPRSAAVRHLVTLTKELIGFPRHLSQHVGGFVITHGPLCEVVPIENAAMPERTVVQWNKDDLDVLNILKVDCLALGMLTALRKCFDLVGQHTGRRLTLADLPDEPAVYEMMSRADTVGVFQIESRGQMSMLPRLRPQCFYDLVIEIAIMRPGPIQGGMVHPYLRRRHGLEPVTYPDPAAEQVLKKTLGVPLFQEQVMRLAIVCAGFSPGEADRLRRAMGSWRRSDLIDKFRTLLRERMIERGLPAAFAEQVYEQVRGFGEYGFPESHAASFALLAYASAWLKFHYPACFTSALLNSQPMGFYAPAQLVRDARQHGVQVLPVDVNHSGWDCTLEKRDSALALRLGLRLVHKFPQRAAEALVRARNERPFGSVADLARRTQVPRSALARLAAADAFASLGLSRRTALWNVLAVAEELPLFAGVEDDDLALPPLPEHSLGEKVSADYASVGLSLVAHPIGLLRSELDVLGVTPNGDLPQTPDKTFVRVAGLVVVRQHPSTAKGTIFVTLEDETDTANLVVRPRVWDRFRRIARRAVALVAEGKIERSMNVIHLVVSRLDDLTDRLRGLLARSRDFR